VRFGALARLVGREFGAHGYDPARFSEMRGIFVALGRGVPRGVRLPPVRAIDVAPTVARLLAIEAPAGSEGTALDALSASPSTPSTPSTPAPPPPSPAR
jgi:hypothetical protein